jgi:arylsulfatase A-like enzyme
MVADKRWKYCYSEIGGSEELYDLANDPDELQNISDRAESVPLLETMRRRLRQWAEENGDEEILAGDTLAVNHKDVLANVEFRPNTMGWRWH